MKTENITSAQFSAKNVDKNTIIKPQGDENTDIDLKTFFDDLTEMWSKLMQLVKLLRNVIQDYNQKKQILVWEIQTNFLQSKEKSIAQEYKADYSSALGNIFAGLTGIAGAGASPFSEMSPMFGRGAGEAINGISGYVSAVDKRGANTEGAIAELQRQGSDSYNQSLNATLSSAREYIEKMLAMGQSIISQQEKVYQALSGR